MVPVTCQSRGNSYITDTEVLLNIIVLISIDPVKVGLHVHEVARVLCLTLNICKRKRRQISVATEKAAGLHKWRLVG